ncbi:MAG: GNAT family N-acetyltransferase [Chryseobacterium sp.]|jgi:RimJ/RimL family protein N-acetyltransferase|uniref:GNAT family N-acetyltransferase n=1 Tax=Chryseobacterium sp. TaxID=1871047 RepID=UPI00283399C9|nr:GNAT family protein [Chryseobacterium sp.]MDR2235300.1 GNAT family N-acetyltransferase [Chryseobacterium sp.]
MEHTIVLRKLSADDATALSRLADNKNIWDNMRDIFPHPYTLKDAQQFIGMVAAEDPQMSFAIEYNGHFAGMISLIRQPDVYRKSAEIGFWIGEEYWGKKIVSISTQKLIDYAIKNLDLNRIFARVFEYNTASMKVLKNNGFIEEGVSIDAVYKNNQFYDLHHFYLLIRNV